MAEFWVGWEAVSLVIALISVIGSALAIMAGRVFSSKEIENAAKAELVFAFSTLAIVLLLIAAVNFADGVANQFAKESSVVMFGHYVHTENFWEFAKAYMNMVYQCYLSAEKMLVSLDAVFALIGSFKIFVSYFDPMKAFPFEVMREAVENLLNIIYFLKLGYKLMIKTVDFFYYIGFPILMPTGVALRAFPPTRGTGAYLIAFCVGLYFVFPVAYLLAVGLMYVPYSCPFMFAGPFMKITPIILDPCELNDPFGVFGIVYAWFIANQAPIKVFLTEGINAVLQQFCLNLCIFPFVAIMIMFSFINSGSSLFGANIPEIGRGLVKLI